MKNIKFHISAMLIIMFGILMQSCQQRLNDEEKAREKAMKEIEQAKEAINDYLTIVEERHVDILDIKISEMNKAMKTLRFKRKGFTDSKDVEDKMEVLSAHKKLLTHRIDEIRQSCSDGCDGFSVKIGGLLDDLDKHLNLVDSLLLDIE